MKIKKYFASDMKKALNMARDEQGPDVVILSNRKVMGGIELLAAEDYDERLFEKEKAKLNADANNRTSDSVVRQETAATTPTVSYGSSNSLWTQDEVLERMQDEIHSLRRLLEQQMSGLAWGEMGRSHPLWASLIRRFGQLGLNSAISRELVKQVPQNMELEKAWRMCLALMSYRLKSLDDNILTSGNVIAFIGSSGAGKTTTVAKIATRMAMTSQAENLILATTDSYRVGGRDHLRSYARILGIPIRTIHNANEMHSLLDQYYGHKTILIDTAGLSPIDENQSVQMAILGAEKTRIKTCLVLSASTQTVNATGAAANFYQNIPADYSVITKLDETVSMGSLLSYLIEKELPVAYMSSGQRVPEDLQKAEPHKLIARAIATMKQANHLQMGEEELEQLYGEFASMQSFGE